MKTRGLREAGKNLGDIESIIENLLEKKARIKIFESGCGYGLLMMNLAKKYGPRVEIIGMNLKPKHGDEKKMIDLAMKKRVLSKEDLKNFNLPKIIFGDAGVKLPFKSGSIDLVLSQISTPFYNDKMHFFEEVSRVLSKEGIARITPGFYMFNFKEGTEPEFRERIKIYKKGKKIPVESFLKKFKTLKLIRLTNGFVLEIKKGKLDFGLQLEAVVNYDHLNKKWFGTQSIYYVK